MKQLSAKPSHQLHFHRWVRKNYAIYNSLKKQIKICVLTVGCSILTLSTSAFASVSTVQKMIEDDEVLDEIPDTIALEVVLVQAPPKPVVSSLSRVVVSFDKQDLQKFPVQNLQHILQYVGGLDLQERSGQGIQADVRIRGGSYDQAMIMLNGVNLTDPQTGHHNLNLPIDLSSVERIEILQGPGSRVLGAHAFSGAINIVTTPSDSNSMGAKIVAGQHHFSEMSAHANLIYKSLKLHASAGKSGSTGYIPNTDFDVNNAFLHLQIGNLQNGEIHFQSGYQLKSFGANAFYSHAYPEQYEKLRTFINALSYKQNISKINLNANVYHRRSFDRFELFRNESPAWYTGHNYHQSDVAGANIRSEYAYFPWKTTIGGEFRGEHIFSNNLGEEMANQKRVPFERDAVFFTKEKLRATGSWFAEQSFYASRLSISLGAMGNYSNDFGHYTCFGTDMSYQLSRNWSAFAAFNQAVRLPTFTDLYYSSATNVGNSNLKPERSNTFEIGSKFNAFGFFSTFSGFYRKGYNTIDWVRKAGESVYKTENHSELGTFGVEADALYLFKNDYLKSLRVAYAFLDMSKNNLGLESGKALEYLRHKITASASVNIVRNLHFSLSWRYQIRAGVYLDLEQQMQDYAPISLFDARLEWRAKNHQIFVETSNLFDEEYFDFANLIQAGRWVKAGICVSMNK